MRILIYKRKGGHRWWYQSFARYLKRKGHTVELCVGRPLARIDADVLVMWNGNLPVERDLARRCHEEGIGLAYMEHGFFPQRRYTMLSRYGSVGGDLFRGEPIPDLPPDGEARLQEFFVRYAGEEVIKAHEGAPKDYVAGFLQLPRDTAIRHHSPYRTMQQVVEAGGARFYGEKVIWKIHPRDPSPDVQTKWPLVRGSIWPHILSAKACVAVNSTCLYEAALAGVPVTALGECPLSLHPDRHREIVHEILLRQLPVGSIDIDEQVHRSVGDLFE